MANIPKAWLFTWICSSLYFSALKYWNSYLIFSWYFSQSQLPFTVKILIICMTPRIDDIAHISYINYHKKKLYSNFIPDVKIIRYPLKFSQNKTLVYRVLTMQHWNIETLKMFPKHNLNMSISLYVLGTNKFKSILFLSTFVLRMDPQMLSVLQSWFFPLWKFLLKAPRVNEEYFL